MYSGVGINKSYIYNSQLLSFTYVCDHQVNNKNFMAPFYGWGSTASSLEPLGGGSLLFTTKSPEIPETPGLKIQHLNC